MAGYVICLPLVPSSEKLVELAKCCQPGDITVTPIHTGYLIGRALPQDLGPGPWWEYIAVVRRLNDALHHARTLAAQDGVKAWMHMTGDRFDPLPE